MTAKLISITPDAEKVMLYIARVSSENQDNTDTGLLKYCLKHGHWSVFEHAFVTLEIETSRAISAQIIRHRSFAFSEFSQRYSSEMPDSWIYSARKQSEKNRQSSSEDCEPETVDWFETAQSCVIDYAQGKYAEALERGVAREQARMLLPLSTGTRLYMSGSIRSWIHYVQLRTQPDTQAEHRVVAEDCKKLLAVELPTLAAALEWRNR